MKFDLEVKHIDDKLQDWMLNYDWPGNVRELKAVIERGMNIVDGDTLSMNDLYFSTPGCLLIQQLRKPCLCKV